MTLDKPDTPVNGTTHLPGQTGELGRAVDTSHPAISPPRVDLALAALLSEVEHAASVLAAAESFDVTADAARSMRHEVARLLRAACRAAESASIRPEPQGFEVVHNVLWANARTHAGTAMSLWPATPADLVGFRPSYVACFLQRLAQGHPATLDVLAASPSTAVRITAATLRAHGAS